MVNIRLYKNTDKTDVENICIQTADEKLRSTPKKKEILLLQYNRYYTRSCQQTTFVAEDDGKVVGYVLCDTHYSSFLKNFRKNELKNLLKLDFFGAISFYLELVGQKIYSKNHQAHLHIDILNEYQRQGIGHRLIDALRKELNQMDVDGVFLTVSADNEKGVNFYKKYGFSEIYRCKHFLVLGINP